MIRLRWLIAGVLLATVAGCSTQTFVGQQYANFTAYYNKFYNAQKAFDQGVRATEQVNEPIDRDQYLSLFVPAGNAPDPAPFDRAIKKSSDVLREHAGSKWIDDALLLIGKSYFYQRNFVGAEQKFREIIAIESELEGEARFWLGRVLVAAENYTAAADHLQGSLDAATLDDRWAAMTSLVLGELRVQQEQWPEAAAALQQGLEGDVGNAAEAEASFLLGQVLETLGTYEGAVQAYERAARQSPSYELSYAAQASTVRVQGLHLNADEALRTLRNMEADGKNFDKRKELALLRGRLRAAQDRPRAAERVYRDLLYGENDPARGDLKGRAHHALAVLYRDAYRDFSAAAAHFDTASSSLARPNERSLRRAPAAIRDSREQARVFGAVANRASDVARMDSLLRLGQLDDEAFQTFVADLQEQRAAEQAAQRAARERQQATRQFAQNQPRGGTMGRAATSQSQAVNTAGGEAGFLFYKDPGRAQQAQQAFRQRWGDRPRVPNWRRRGAISGQITSNEADGAPGAATPTTAAAQGPAVSLVDVSEVPRDSASQAEMRADRALARYELGNALFLTANRPDSAAAWYRRVTKEDSEYPVSRRALYALAEARTATGDTAAAQRLYRRVVTQYPQSAFAERAQDQLGTPAGRSQAAASAADSTALARQAYDAAYQQWKQNRHAAALEEMVRVAEQYASTDAAPRALLAAGTIYLEQLRADSVQTDSIRASTPLPDVFASVLSLTDSTQVSTQVSSPDSTARPTAEPSLADSVRSPRARSGGLQRDSLRAGRLPADSLRTLADSSRTPADSVTFAAIRRALPDSLRLPDPAAASSPDLAAAGPPPLSIERLFSHIASRYPDSKPAERANLVLAAWTQPAPPEAPAAAPPDSAARSATPADSATTTPPDTSATDTPPADGAVPAIQRRTNAPPNPANADSVQTASPDTTAPSDTTGPDARNALPAPRTPPGQRAAPQQPLPDSTSAPPDTSSAAAQEQR